MVSHKNKLIITAVVSAASVVCRKIKIRRKPKVIRKRLNVEFHFETLLQENEFRVYYRMSQSAFENLLSLIAPVYMKEKSRPYPDQISLCNKLQMTISWLSGGTYIPFDVY